MKAEAKIEDVFDHAEKLKFPEIKIKSANVADNLLWNSFKNGDVEAYAVIYRKYFFTLYNYGKKIYKDQEFVKDTIQELFIKIWNNRENLKETNSIKFYLITSLRRKLIDSFRSNGSKLISDQENILLELGSDDQEPEDELFEKKEAVLRALNKLSTHQQKLLQLKFYKNLSNQEIAIELDITIQSVYNAVFKALRSLKKNLTLVILFYFISL